MDSTSFKLCKSRNLFQSLSSKFYYFVVTVVTTLLGWQNKVSIFLQQAVQVHLNILSQQDEQRDGAVLFSRAECCGRTQFGKHFRISHPLPTTGEGGGECRRRCCMCWLPTTPTVDNTDCYRFYLDWATASWQIFMSPTGWLDNWFKNIRIGHLFMYIDRKVHLSLPDFVLSVDKPRTLHMDRRQSIGSIGLSLYEGAIFPLYVKPFLFYILGPFYSRQPWTVWTKSVRSC